MNDEVRLKAMAVHTALIDSSVPGIRPQTCPGSERTKGFFAHLFPAIPPIAAFIHYVVRKSTDNK
jgi:hypothetical protein